MITPPYTGARIMASYKVIRLVHHINAQCKPTRTTLSNAVRAWLMEEVQGEAERIVHYAVEGFKRPSRNGRRDDDDAQ